MREIFSGRSLGLLALLFSSAGMAASVQVNPSNTTVIPGEVFTVNVSATAFPGNGSTTGVTGGSFTFTFDGSVVAILGASLPGGNPNTPANPFDFITPLTIIDANTVGLSVLRNGTTGFNYASGDFAAFTLQFQVLNSAAPGAAANIVMIDDGIDNSWTLQDATALTGIVYTQASVCVNSCSAPDAPDIAVTDSVAPTGDHTIPFGNLTVFSSASRTVTVTNQGNQDLVLGTLAQTNSLAAPFSLVNDTCSGQTLTPAANCTVDVWFSPVSLGGISDSFSIPSNDPETPTVTVLVSGTGVPPPAPNIAVTDSVSPTSDHQVPFSDIPVSNTSTQTVTVANTGSALLTLGQITPLEAPFSVANDNCSNQSLMPSASCTFQVRFSPTVAGSFSDTLDIPSNDPDTPTVTVSMSGTSSIAPRYYPSGPQTNVPLSTVTAGGWQQCYAAPMSTSIGNNAQNVLSACHGTYLMMAGRQTGSDTFLVVAAAPLTEATRNTNGGSNTHLANGSNWYFTPNWSWGFTAANDTVNLNSCDTGASSPTSMCLHTDSGGGYRINDITGLNSSNSYEKVFFVDLPPGAHDDAATTLLSTPVTVDVLANDIGFDDPATVTVVTPPANGTAVVIGSPGGQAGIRIRYTANGGYGGADSLVYQVTDGDRTGTATLNITVRDFKANNDNFVVLRNPYYCCDSHEFYVLSNDFGFIDPVSVSIITPPNRQGSAYVYSSPGPRSQVYIYYNPYPPANGLGDYTETFTYQVSDGVHTDTATVSVEVVNFKAQDDATTTNLGEPVTINVGTNDLGFAYPATAGIYSSALHGNLVMHGSPGDTNDITITYQPDPGFKGTDTFQYAMDDGTHIGIATVTVAVITDADHDGSDDGVDNCLGTSNPDQYDADGDGYGSACDGDLNNDGFVNFADLALFRLRFGTHDRVADFDGNGIVNFADLAKFRTLFGKAPGPSGLIP